MTERLVVIGGDAAGMTAAATARRRRSTDQLDIVAFEKGSYTSYSACGIPYLIGGLVDDVNALIARDPEELRPFPEQIGVSMTGGFMHLPLGDDATGVDPDRECYPAGQGVGAIHDLVPAGELVHRFVEEAERALAGADATVT